MDINQIIQYLIVMAFTIYVIINFVRAFWADKVWLKRICAVGLIFLLYITCYLAANSLLKNYPQDFNVKLVRQTVTTLLMLTIQLYLLIEYRIRMEQEVGIFRGYLLLMLLLPVSSIIISLLTLISEATPIILFFVLVLLLVMNTVIFYLYDAVLQNYHDRFQKNLLEQQLYAYRNQLQTNLEPQNKIYGIKHDLKHHLSTLEHMLDENTSRQVHTYLQGMISSMENPLEYSNSGNKDVDGVLNYYMQEAENRGIRVEKKINITEQLDSSFFELNVILSNLFENAITAARHSVEKYIIIKVETKQNLLYIDMENSHMGEIKENNGNFQTSKITPSHHGYGLKNVKAMVERSHGTLKVEYNDKIFLIGILLYIDEI